MQLMAACHPILWGRGAWGLIQGHGFDVRGPTIQLHEQLVEGVLLLTLASKVVSASLPAHCINLIDEQYAGGVLTRQGKHVPNLEKDRDAHADEYTWCCKSGKILHTDQARQLLGSHGD